MEQRAKKIQHNLKVEMRKLKTEISVLKKTWQVK